jgi:hypothetical protein
MPIALGRNLKTDLSGKNSEFSAYIPERSIMLLF